MTRKELSPTERTRLGRHRERGKDERADLYAVLDAGVVCHLGMVRDGSPLVLPTCYGRDGDTLYVHGSVAARNLVAAGTGLEVCVTITHLDGLVLARSVFDHSMNYRSAVILGTARQVTDPDEVLTGLRVITEQVVPGRWEDGGARLPTRKELAATTVLAVALDEASVKVRDAPPGEDEENDVEHWAGVLPVRTVIGEPVPAPDLAPGIPVPAHVQKRASAPL
ncbi:MAG: pyridoxamine 5'-phosphate oxidase family protein [Streptosporangiales bacterium]|nr:pyridoxamine 5'-phosphate oxidase family protein [Streptosporangiales bacterium]